MKANIARHQGKTPLRLATFLVLGFVNFILSAPAAASEGRTTPEITKAYQACLIRADLAYTSDEKAFISDSRKAFDKQLSPYLGKNDPQTKRAYDLTLARLLNRVGSSITMKTFAAFEAMSAEANLKRMVSLTAGLNNPAYLKFHASFTKSIFSQKEVDLAQFEKDRHNLIGHVIAGSMNRMDEMRGLSVPTSLTMQDRSAVASAIASINQISELTYRGQTLNRDLRKDRSRHLKARVRQAAFGVGGFAVLVGTLYVGPLVVSTGGAAAQGLGVAAIVGEMGGGALLGGAGGAAAEATVLAYEIVSRAYYQSLELNTPFSCELQKTMNEESMTNALLEGATFGTALGVGGTGVAALIPKITLWLMGGAVVAGQTNELVNMGYEFYQMRSYYGLAQELTDLENVPSHLEREQINLIRAALTKARTHAKNAGQSTVDALIIGTLSKQFFLDGDFRRAMSSGTDLIKALTASSADTLPSVALSVSSATVNGIEALQNPKTSGAESNLFARSEKLIQAIKGEGSVAATSGRLELHLK